ncbi:MAG TPA: hypothetical protein VK324_02705 [Tepidisphaeraceae bacterium]|nr:hypothetical protein [Tepidisphaeraceae bacterium]
MSTASLIAARPRALAPAVVEQLESRQLLSTVTINHDSVVQSNFIGLGNNVLRSSGNSTDPGQYSTEQWNNTVGKTLREQNRDGYARVFYGLNSYFDKSGNVTATSAGMNHLVDVISKLKDYGIKVAVSGIYSAMPDYLKQYDSNENAVLLSEQTKIDAWADATGQMMKYLVVTKGLTNIVHWNLSNELAGMSDTDKFDVGGNQVKMAEYQKHVRAAEAEFTEQKLPATFQNLDTDAQGHTSSIRGTMDYATKEMADVSNVYGVHDYPHSEKWYIRTENADTTWGWEELAAENGTTSWNDASVYATTVKKYKMLTKYYGDYLITGSKPFVIGEVGGPGYSEKPSTYTKDESRERDSAGYAQFLAERAIAGLNTGIAAMAKWGLNDYRSVYGGTWTYYNTWGQIKDNGTGATVGSLTYRNHHYGWGIINRYVRGNSKVFATSSSDSLIRAAAVRHNSDSKYTVVATNHGTSDASVTFDFNGANTGALGTWRRFVYDPDSVDTNPGGDLPSHTGTLTFNSSGQITDTIPNGAIVVYTNEYDTTAPNQTTGGSTTASGTGVKLAWTKSSASDLSYYRVFRGTTSTFTPAESNQIGSTIGTTYTDTPGSGTFFYKVAAVDKYGNQGTASAAIRWPVASLTKRTISSASTTSTTNASYLSETYDGKFKNYGSHQTFGLMNGNSVTYNFASAQTVSRIDLGVSVQAVKDFDIEVLVGGTWTSKGRWTWDGTTGSYSNFDIGSTSNVTGVRITARSDHMYIDEVAIYG